jgi:hypothetical protein
LLDREKLEFAMQGGAARNMKDLVVCILGDCYEPGGRRRIGSAWRALVFRAAQENPFRREKGEA